MNLSFLTIGDDDFFDSIQISVHQARRFHPQASFYIYDWGLTDAQRAELNAASNVEAIIDWTDRFVDLPVIDEVDWAIVMQEVEAKRPSGSLLNRLKKVISKYVLFREQHWKSLDEKGESQKQSERNYIQKPFCILDCLERAESRLIYLDGDAFLLSNIEDLLDRSFDIGVTLRREHEIRRGRNNCQVLNAGVLFFNGSPDKTRAFLDAWIDQMGQTCEYLIEQTALTRLIDQSSPQIFNDYFNQGTISLGEEDIRVLTLPCDRYNFNWIEEGVDLETTKVVHFKGGRHSNDRFQDLLEEINVSLSFARGRGADSLNINK
ncbi:hypothetical protein GGQ21_002677 [Salinibacter ruber]|jgi:hypothetical protein|uniref:hypothetical protein n=1 Tax=Salinibacter ruber TaxID=146919 RepID=UPI0020731097|nr:hypothetical protein [Salinibacter ruber]MCS3672007.1 hypothetical protein [Salinibacter ruber]